MPLPNKVDKENFRLLDLSSDEESDDLHLEIIPSRKKKITRRDRSRGSAPKAPEPNFGTEVRCALRWALRGTLLLWLLMLTWICATLYDQVSVMRMDITKVMTSSESIGDTLQLYHSKAKDLQANASNLNARLTKLEHEHQELVKKVGQATGDLAQVSAQLAAEPMLADTPKRLAELQRTVAYFGSQINGFDDALNSARKQAATAASGVEEVKNLLHALEAKTNETIANISANGKMDGELKEQLGALNSTLTQQMQLLQTRLEEVNKLTSTVAPSTTTAAPSSSTSSSTSTTTTTTTTRPPGPPSKPFVVQ
ncbi:unnamed protein product [Diatraea saccharalis]|uniref:Uncharacterized protein n=1 Tax=Diatraea saccharalis TaxID=40085 RepID=A0A9N9WJX8_9NEOP|nr:unnamed protein product [Diatraea saccharalis]